MTTLGRARAAAAALAILVLASGCGDGGQAGGGAAEEGGEPQRGGTAITVELADIALPMPLVSESVLDGSLQDIMYMTLLRGVWRDGELAYVPAGENPMALARSYEYFGPDSASLRYHMRSDARWSDGEPITAHDVVFTYELLGDPAVASARQDYVEHIDSVVAENDSTVVFHFGNRYPEMLFHSGHAVVPRHVFQDVAPGELRTHPTVTNPANGALVVSGSFMIGGWQPGQRVTLVPNPHFQPAPYLDQIVIRIIPEAATRIVEMSTGSVDMLIGVTFDQIPGIQAQAPGVRFEREQRRFYDYIGYNPEAHPAFADPEIRRALGMALDLPAIIAALQMDGYAEPAGGPYAPIFRKYYDPETQAPLAHDPARAAEILEAKGWVDADGDGIREKDGRALSFTLVTNAGNQRRADVSQIAQQQWRRVGVDAELQQLEFNTLMENMIGQEYEAVLGGWSVGLSPDLTGLWGADARFNVTGYQNPELSRLFQQALAQPTEELAIPYWKEAAALLARDQPYTWLYYMDQVDPVSPRLRDTRIDTFGHYQNVWEWWIRQ